MKKKLIHECDTAPETSVLCRDFNNLYDQFCGQGTIPPAPLTAIEMFHVLRRQLIKMQLIRLLSCGLCDEGQPARMLSLGVGRDDMFIRLGHNPNLHITCVDKDEVVQDVLAEYGESNIPPNVRYVALDIEAAIDAISDLILQHDIIVCEGIFIYLSAPVANATLDAVERAGSIIVFNIANAALKRYNPKLWHTTIEDLQLGTLREVARVPIHEVAHAAGFTQASTDVQTWVITLAASSRADKVIPRE